MGHYQVIIFKRLCHYLGHYNYLAKVNIFILGCGYPGSRTHQYWVACTPISPVCVFFLQFVGNCKTFFLNFAQNSGISVNECNKIRVICNNLQGFPLSSRILWEPGSQVLRKYSALGYTHKIPDFLGGGIFCVKNVRI